MNCRVCIEEVKESGFQRAVYDSIGENSFMLFYTTAEQSNASAVGGRTPLKTTSTPHVGMVSMPSPPQAVQA